MRAIEFITEGKEKYEGINIQMSKHQGPYNMQLVINALTDDGKLLGFVIFNIGDSRELDPQELEVVEKYRGQGVAKVMYDYVKSKGYKIIKSPDVTKISDQGTQSGEHFWQKNRGEETVWEGRENYNGINMLLQSDEDEVYVKASAGPRELGHVLFVIDGEYLLPQDLEVEPQYRGYKIAQKMYDFVKSKGYKIRRSGNQTADGSKFWAKHRPEQNVWEDSMTKGRNLSPATEKYIKNHKWKLTTVDPMSLDIDSFDDPFNRVIDIDTEHPINLKDPVIVHHNGSTILDGFHRVYQAQRQGLKSIPAYIPIQKQVSEAFTNPYNFKWEKGEHGDWDAMATASDSTPIHIMFNNEGDDEWQVEFYRSNTQSITGEGDAQRIFSTVLSAIQQFIQKEQPWRIIFSASKDVEPGQNNQSRAKLYNSLVKRYARAWGYDEYSEDHGDQVTYELTRLKQPVNEESAPEILYHATYRPLLKSIKQHGLGGDKAQAKWEDSKPGVVYLATDPNVAESYAESNDVVPDEWLDQIVVLKVNASQLDQSKLKLDRNVIDNQGDTLEYHGVIPVNLLS